jgi:hypothetical protein
VTILRVNGFGFGPGDKVTSGQFNQMDLNPTYALDKRAGQTDALASVVSCTGAGRIVGSYAAGADADTTYLIASGNSTVDTSTLTADRAYTFSNTGAVAGDTVYVLNRSSFYVTVKNGAGATLIVLGSTIQGNAESTWCELVFTGAVWILAESALRPQLTSTIFTATGVPTANWTCPRGVTLALLIGYGGGGGGGGGGTGSTGAAPICPTGGGGGGGSFERAILVAVTPGTNYAVTIGTGGTGGTAGADGNPGSDTTFDVLATMIGAGGGIAGGLNSVNAGAMGGGPSRLLSNAVSNTRTTLDMQALVQRTPGAGGPGRNDPNNAGFTGLAGTGSVQGFAGGNGGGAGTTSGTANGGGGGGGGGAGPGGAGGAAGAGGGGGSIGSGGPGIAGTAAAANTGAGGGAGGAGGQCTAGGASSPGPGGTGGTGGSGKLIVVPLR